MASKRKGITKKTRFEVFKRDGFTCQYCGRMAPDVILEVDHINPVANGGGNDIMNLVTSCRDCNRGKGKRVLSDRGEVKAQQKQLKELSERREQLEMMIEWRKELSRLNDMQIDAVENEVTSITGRQLTVIGRTYIANVIERFGLNEACEAAKIYAENYYDSKSDEFVRPLETIGGICRNREIQRKDPSVRWINKIAYFTHEKFPDVPKEEVRGILRGRTVTESGSKEAVGKVFSAGSWDELKEWLEGGNLDGN